MILTAFQGGIGMRLAHNLNIASIRFLTSLRTRDSVHN